MKTLPGTSNQQGNNCEPANNSARGWRLSLACHELQLPRRRGPRGPGAAGAARAARPHLPAAARPGGGARGADGRRLGLGARDPGDVGRLRLVVSRPRFHDQPGIHPSPQLPPHVPANLWDPLPKEQETFAKLLTPNVLLRNETLSWYSQPGLKGVYLSPGLNYSEDTRELVMAQDGAYYVFLQLELQRKATLQNGGEVSLTLLLQPPQVGAAALGLTVHLPCSSESRNSAGGFRGGLLHLSAGQRLSVRLSVHLHGKANAQDAWQLAQGGTALGLFRMTTKVPDGFF
ncbi:tumor necrosis factor ligand superfamily member 9 [Ictidomys tridecemlineatus]